MKFNDHLKKGKLETSKKFFFVWIVWKPELKTPKFKQKPGNTNKKEKKICLDSLVFCLDFRDSS
jgi:hypothetical protein